MKKLLYITLLLVALPVAAQTVQGTATTWFSPTSAAPAANLTSQSTGVPGSVSGYTPLEPLTAFNGGTYANFADYLATMYKLAITVGALIAVVMLVTGGVRYMLSESFTDIDKAKKRIISALWGLTILIGSFLILYTINPNLLSFNLQLPNVNQQSSQYSAATGGTTNSNQQVLTPTQMSVAQGLAVGSALGCDLISPTCTAWGSYITYNPTNATNADVQKAIADYTASCQGYNNLWLGTVKTLDGSLLGSSGQTALVCAGPGH